ncbi:unnamed protein product [Zymoseptoria tritici ST99CH_3D7]|uniref:Uncharacterized protein n=1 Tax=Zymoseptoria tritici (strain ST99CH_3D7) TaxID=1276538 RepID=A0A1X7S038_ZYMT9|nr:unnamed protein product [Zymoseptoria tritici ST99CH_3D7]
MIFKQHHNDQLKPSQASFAFRRTPTTTNRTKLTFTHPLYHTRTKSTMSTPTTHLEPASAASASNSQSTSATTSRSQTPAGDRRKSGAYDSAPSQGVWEADKERQHKGFLQMVLGNKLTPSFLK